MASKRKYPLTYQSYWALLSQAQRNEWIALAWEEAIAEDKLRSA